MQMNWMRLMNDFPREGEGVGGGGSEGASPAPGSEGGDVGSLSPPPSALDTGTVTPVDPNANPASGDDTPAGGEGEGAKPNDPPPPDPFDAAKLTLPEGLTLPEEIGKTFADTLNNPDLSPQERGQALLDLYSKQMTEQAEAGMKAAADSWTEMTAKWRDEIKALPEFTGKVDAELGAVKQALISAGAGDEFFAALNLTGAGNHPAVVQMLHKLTTHLREGGAVGGATKPSSGKTRADIMYPSMTAKE